MITVLDRIAKVVGNLKMLGTIKETDKISFSYEFQQASYKISITLDKDESRLFCEKRLHTMSFCFQQEFKNAISEIELYKRIDGGTKAEMFYCYIQTD